MTDNRDNQRSGPPAADARKRAASRAGEVDRNTPLHGQSRGEDAERRKHNADTGAPEGVNRSNAGEETS